MSILEDFPIIWVNFEGFSNIFGQFWETLVKIPIPFVWILTRDCVQNNTLGSFSFYSYTAKRKIELRLKKEKKQSKEGDVSSSKIQDEGSRSGITQDPCQEPQADRVNIATCTKVADVQPEAKTSSSPSTRTSLSS